MKKKKKYHTFLDLLKILDALTFVPEYYYLLTNTQLKFIVMIIYYC